MSPKALVVALVGIGCIGAAGLGTFLAVRSTSPMPVAALAENQATESTSTTVLPQTVDAGPVPAAKGPQSPSRPASIAPGPSTASSAAAPPMPALTPRTMPNVTSEAQTDASAQTPSASADAAPSAADAPAARVIDERTLVADSVIGIRMDSAVSSETAKVEDRVTARVTRDVKIDGHTAIPAGAQLEGTVTAVERGGKVRGRSRIGIRFNSLVLGEHDRVAIQTDTIFRDGEGPTGEAATKIGASAVVGTILGAVIGGKKGAAIGGATGAAGGTAVVMAGGRNEASIAAGTALTVRLTAPATVQVSRED